MRDYLFELRDSMIPAIRKGRSFYTWMCEGEIAPFFAIALLLVNLHCLFGNVVTAAAILVFLCAYLWMDIKKGITFWCACSYFLYNIHVISYAVSAMLVIGRYIVYFLAKEVKIQKHFIWFLGGTLAIIMVSFLLGFESAITSAALLFANILIFVMLVTYFKKDEQVSVIVDSFYISAFLFAGVVLYSFVESGIDFSERLRFEGNVRDLANALVLPVFFWVNGFISGKYHGRIPRPMQDVMGIVFTGFLALTQSKGAILALGLGVLLYCILGKHLNKRFWALVALAVVGIAVLQVSGLVDFSRFLERNTDLNGRTRIWAFYFEKTQERGILGVIFGLGPGNIKRVAVDDYLGKYYVHSTILDFYYSYGVVGFAAFCGGVGALFKKVIQGRSKLCFAFLFFALASFFITGASTNTQIFVIFAYIWAMSEWNSQKMKLKE